MKYKNMAMCRMCGGGGEVDSGGQSPQGYFINIRCPTCLGIGRFDMVESAHEADCCGHGIYHVGFVFYVAVDESGMITDAAYSENELCERMYHDYCH